MQTLGNLNFGKAIEMLVPELGSAFFIVLKVTVLSFTLAMVLGLAIALGRISRFKSIRAILTILIEIIRGTPILVQLVYMYYVVPLILSSFIQIFGISYTVKLPAITAGVLGLALNYGCLLSEVIRSSILSIDSGQREAALALGYSNWETLSRVILPQAFRNSIPVFGNYLATIVKDTSLLAYISVPELLLKATSFSSQTFMTIESYTILAVSYLIIAIPLSQLIKYTENKLRKVEKI